MLSNFGERLARQGEELRQGKVVSVNMTFHESYREKAVNA
jgi:hypothetical protein